MKQLTEVFLIDQYFRLKGLVKQSSPVFACKVNLQNFCFIYKTINIDDIRHLKSKEKILTAFKRSLGSNFKIENEIFVINRFAEVHDNIYSLRNPPRKITSEHVCKFDKFMSVLNQDPRLKLDLKNNEIIISH